MTNNVITIQNASKAKVSWSVNHNGEKVDNSSLDSIKININGEEIEIDTDKSMVEVDIDKTSEINMEIGYEGSTFVTKPVQINMTVPFYYGTLAMSNLMWDKGGEADIKDYLELMDQDLLNGLIDKDPLMSNKGLSAHAGLLVEDRNGKYFNKDYGFVFADENVICSQAVVLYPTELGEVSEFLDASGAAMSKDAWYSQTISLNDVEYYIYILKDFVSNDGYTYITINQ